MAEQSKPEQSKPEKSVRLQKREARIAAVRKAAQVRRVRVVPRDDEARKVLRHPRAGGFRESGSVEWPLDTFTKRRIADGAVTVEERQQQDARRAPRHPGRTESGGSPPAA